MSKIHMAGTKVHMNHEKAIMNKEGVKGIVLPPLGRVRRLVAGIQCVIFSWTAKHGHEKQPKPCER